MTKFDQNRKYVFDLLAYIDALAKGHFNRKHNTVWTAFNKDTDALINMPVTLGRDIKAYFRNTAKNYPGTGARGATDEGAANAGRHISALVKFGVLIPV